MSASSYLLVGDEFLVDEALDRVRSETGSDPLSEAVFDDAAAASDIAEALETRSLLGGRRLVVVHGADRLKADRVERLAAYLADPGTDAVLVLVASGRTKLDAAIKKAGTVVSLDAPRGRALADWVRRRGAAAGLQLDDRAAWALIDAAGSDLRALNGALDQLAAGTGGGRVGQADVRARFPRLADERMYAFTDAVGERRLAAAMATLRRLLDQGDEPIVVLGALAAHVRRLIRARPHAERGGRGVGEALGLPGWRAERLARQARAFHEDELAGALARLAEADVTIKGGELPAEVALERAVVAIVAGGVRS